MARKTFPDAGSQLAFGVSGGYLAHRVGSSVVFYTTSALTTLADVRVRNADGSTGSAYTGSAVPVNSASMLPLFLGPDDDSDTLWYDRGGGVAEAVYARTDDRLDALEAASTDHLTDAVDAHDASAISFAPTGTIAATTVQAAVAEVASEGVATAATTQAAVDRLETLQFVIEDYGAAVGDGVANDVAHVNAAITAANAAGGGKVTGRAGAVYGVAATVAMKSNVTLDGVRLKDITGNLSIVSLADCADATVQNCHFTGSGTLGTAGRGAIWGVLGGSTGPTRCKVINNIINVVGTCGIAMDTATDCVISGNIIRRPVEHGIYLSANSVGCSITDNVVDEAGFGGVSTVNGIKLAGPVRSLISGNVVLASLADGILCESGTVDCQVTDNVVRSSGNHGIRVNAGAADLLIADNTVLDSASAAIRAIGGVRIRIASNKVRNSAGTCIQVSSGTTDIAVDGNYVVQTGGSYSFDITGTRHSLSGNYSQATGADAGIVIRATSTGCVVHPDNYSPAGVTNSAGAGAKICTTMANVAAASTLGSVVFKVEAFDAGGASIGFLPVYNTIT